MSARILVFIENNGNITLYNLTEHLTRNPIIRKHSNSIELDIGTDSPTLFVKAIKFEAGLLRIRKITQIPENSTANREKVLRRKMDNLEAISFLFDEERYWEAHMMLETLWKCTTGDEKAYIQNMIHLSVSMIKFQMGQGDTARIVFARAARKLGTPENFSYPFHMPLSEI